jgi:hypothetical protein
MNKIDSNKVMHQTHGDRWSLYHGDCVALASDVPDNSIDLSVYSPPFSNLYIYGDSEADMGNTDGDDQFLEQYRFLVREKHRITRPGRMSAIHVKDLVYYQNATEDSSSGIRPFSDECTRIHLQEGFKLQCRITIWRDPVIEQRKTNAHGLLYKSFRTRADICRVGMPEYLLVFRKWPQTERESALQVPVVHDPASTPLPVWQELASPVWPASATVWNYAGPIGLHHDGRGDDARVIARTSGGRSGGGDLDLQSTRVLNVQQARDPNAERHLCPMPLNITGRAIGLWSNAGDVVWSPFAGIGSEGVVAVEMGRRFIGSELNPNYYRSAAGHIESASKQGRQLDLLEAIA